MRISKRIGFSLAAAAVLTLSLAGVAAAGNPSYLAAGSTSAFTGPSLASKTIDTEAGSCGSHCDSAAVYGANGFTGTLTFDSVGQVTVWDDICVHTPGTGPFVSYGGSYTLSLFDGATSLGSATYTVQNAVSCTAGANPVNTSTNPGLTFTVPASKTVSYTVSIAGVTAGSSAQAAFHTYNSIRNEAHAGNCSHTASNSVPPPTNFVIPEAPFAVLLPLSAGLAAAMYTMRRPRKLAGVAA